MKRCPQCGIDKPLAGYWTRSGKRAGQPRGTCKDCEAQKYREWREANRKKHRELNRRWRAENPEAVARFSRAKKVKARYGITLAESDEILARGCAICGTHELLGIDHCHASGRVRDALCRRCNIAIGHMDDDPARLRDAANYLEQHA